LAVISRKPGVHDVTPLPAIISAKSEVEFAKLVEKRFLQLIVVPPISFDTSDYTQKKYGHVVEGALRPGCGAFRIVVPQSGPGRVQEPLRPFHDRHY
jgi:hypothetical protein